MPPHCYALPVRGVLGLPLVRDSPWAHIKPALLLALAKPASGSAFSRWLYRPADWFGSKAAPRDRGNAPRGIQPFCGIGSPAGTAGTGQGTEAAAARAVTGEGGTGRGERLRLPGLKPGAGRRRVCPGESCVRAAGGSGGLWDRDQDWNRE